MNVSREVVKDAAIGVGLAPNLATLSAIHHPGCAAVLWRRQMAPELTTWMQSLPSDHLPKTRVVLRPDRVKDTLLQVCALSGTPDCPERALLIDDASEMAMAFANILNAPYLRLRFDIITTNACRRFHIDAVTARLVCTYRGTGTQYGISPNGEEPNRVFTVPTGAPIVLRGTLWPETPQSGLLHRSPPIEGTGETRSVLVLDPVFDLEKEI
ncbi:DUF1826 domain-containing protein [Shimia sp. R9_1]|uniref:DUF1826 domain-containing protein n=1 Tax=Shimia sp. R9_1 TaxID=2821111 RepID=UPI001ADCBE5D|nr:DUF1826 domain-containing protein [Shimia sp. R9_1]MBO9409293.1 DUF1826 domain-containing protein [Shimia sp. R9_1]